MPLRQALRQPVAQRGQAGLESDQTRHGRRQRDDHPPRAVDVAIGDDVHIAAPNHDPPHRRALHDPAAKLSRDRQRDRLRAAHDAVLLGAVARREVAFEGPDVALVARRRDEEQREQQRDVPWLGGEDRPDRGRGDVAEALATRRVATDPPLERLAIPLGRTRGLPRRVDRHRLRHRVQRGDREQEVGERSEVGWRLAGETRVGIGRPLAAGDVDVEPSRIRGERRDSKLVHQRTDVVRVGPMNSAPRSTTSEPPAIARLSIRPPTRSRASITATDRPARATSRAAIKPDSPAPTTTTSSRRRVRRRTPFAATASPPEGGDPAAAAAATAAAPTTSCRLLMRCSVTIQQPHEVHLALSSGNDAWPLVETARQPSPATLTAQMAEPVADPTEADIPNPDVARDWLAAMTLIRRFEERAGEMYAKAKVGGFLHLAIGEEATIVGSTRALRDQDYLISTYRSHGHTLARGSAPNAVMAELFCCVDGLCRGRSGQFYINLIISSFRIR